MGEIEEVNQEEERIRVEVIIDQVGEIEEEEVDSEEIGGVVQVEEVEDVQAEEEIVGLEEEGIELLITKSLFKSVFV